MKVKVSPAYEAIVEESNRLGWPEMWKDDLYLHDKKTLDSPDIDEFIWTIRSTGTHLLIPQETPSVLDSRKNWTLAVLESIVKKSKDGDDAEFVYHYFNGKLRRILVEEALGIAHEWISRRSE